MNKYQKIYWSEIYKLKYTINYYYQYSIKDEKINTALNMILAIASSSSIAAWAIWQKYPMFWAAIIVLSNIIHAIKHLLPYTDRISFFSKVSIELQLLFNKYDRKFYDIFEGNLTEEEIHSYTCDLIKDTNVIIHKYLKGKTIPYNNKIRDKAEDITVEEFKKYQ